MDASHLDAYSILHVATGAIQLLVQVPGVGALGAEVGDREAVVRPLGQMLSLAHHAPGPGPALACTVAAGSSPEPDRWPGALS